MKDKKNIANIHRLFEEENFVPNCDNSEFEIGVLLPQIINGTKAKLKLLRNTSAGLAF